MLSHIHPLKLLEPYSTVCLFLNSRPMTGPRNIKQTQNLSHEFMDVYSCYYFQALCFRVSNHGDRYSSYANTLQLVTAALWSVQHSFLSKGHLFVIKWTRLLPRKFGSRNAQSYHLNKLLRNWVCLDGLLFTVLLLPSVNTPTHYGSTHFAIYFLRQSACGQKTFWPSNELSQSGPNLFLCQCYKLWKYLLMRSSWRTYVLYSTAKPHYFHH